MTPGLMFDLVLVVFGLILGSNMGGYAFRIYEVCHLAWKNMGTGGSNRLIRLYLVFAAFSFWVFRGIALVLLSGSGILALTLGPR